MPKYKKKSSGFVEQYIGRKRYNNYVKGAGQLYKDVKMLKSMINPEFKYKDFTAAGQAAATTATFINLNTLVQGTTATQRVGSSIKMASVDCRFTAYVNATAGLNTVRFIVFVDKQPNGAVPLTTDLLAQSLYNSPRNPYNSKRFVILRDISLTPNANGENHKIASYYHKMGIHTEYNGGNSGTITDINSNALYLAVISDNGTNQPLYDYYCRMRWLDN